MKQKSLRKFATILLISCSIGSFAYVNVDNCCAAKRNVLPIEQTAAQMDNAEESVRELPVPVVNLLSRMVLLVQHFTSHNP